MPRILGVEVTLLKPVELKRGDGRRGVTFARIGRDLVVIPLHEGETWQPFEAGGIVILHQRHPPVWCHMAGGKYVRTVLQVN